ncbi:MAG: ABC transporter ATP-binding protein [Candidatus Atribacteria bacterium]|nr:ABC transporter ATP-binding protein [Candidatus Atribacteria bacterium]
MILEVNDLGFAFHKNRLIFNGVNFNVDKGEILSILGPNGSGKSTLLNCIANFYKPQHGSILLNGESISKINLRNIAQIIGYVPQVHIPTYAYTVREFTVMGRTPYIGAFGKPSKMDYRIAEASLKRVGIFHIKDRPYTEISGGERQLALIARVLTQEPKIILFDEPTAHLDYGNQYRIVQMISQLANEGYAVIMTTHNPEHAIILNGKVAILNRNGTFIVGKATDTIDATTLSNLYGLTIKTIYIEEAKRVVSVVISHNDF